MYKVETSKIVDKFLEKHRDLVIRYINCIDIISISPYQNHLDIKPLKWKNNHFRLRIWKYRFLYEIIENKILIYFYEADSRWDVYK